MGEQLQALAKRVPTKYVQIKPGSGGRQFVSHSEITQMALAKIGPFDQRVVEIIRNPDGIVDGCVLEITATVDGQTVTIQEAGDCERPSDNNSANLKMGISSALCRCFMRLGLGLELWAQGHYVLDRALTPQSSE